MSRSEHCIEFHAAPNYTKGRNKEKWPEGQGGWKFEDFAVLKGF